MSASEALKKHTPDDCSDQGLNSTPGYDILKGLRAKQKYIPSRYFYDERGSWLFERICELPEYYQTRTELKLLSDHAEQIMRGFNEGNLVELGSGSNRKIRILLDALGHERLSRICYIPVDICHEALNQSELELKNAYPQLNVKKIVSDFNSDLSCVRSSERKLILFLGSTIGNLDKNQTSQFLKNVADGLNNDDRFLIGLDMMKPVHILQAAYDDSQGITKLFNRNILLVVNRELGADFDPDLFDHVASFNQQHEQIEMCLKAKQDTIIHLSRLNESVVIRKGETIRTEICRKFRKPGVEQTFVEAGLKVQRWITDPRGWFALAEAIKAHNL